MKRIGQITLYKSLYGGILQCTALQLFLRNSGYDCELIQYSADGLIRQKTLPRRILSCCARSVSFLLTLKRCNNTAVFSRKFIRKSRFYKNEKALQAAVDYDSYITGSDQVWNSSNNNRSGAYFLDFAPEGRKRIAYAPSFGVTELSQSYADFCAERLKRFDALSCREEQGAKLIDSLIGVKVPIVLDPVFLLSAEEWSTMMTPVRPKPHYILCYQVGNVPALRKLLSKRVQQLAEKRNCRVIWIGRPGYMRLKDPFAEGWDAGPAEFLRLIQDADAIVTNSFHGLAFSLIFHKEFWIITRTGEKDSNKGLDSRQINLLEKTGLISRWVKPGAEIPDSVSKIDYETVDGILMEGLEKSKSFLRSALTNEPQ
ncbi:MAG: polysaccharide pyruvyl transferase family protein [Lentisphaeria bacterium]|nr:polysaccharide pyruvyl transferase family protein [Lentisphaeria bacterium]